MTYIFEFIRTVSADRHVCIQYCVRVSEDDIN